MIVKIKKIMRKMFKACIDGDKEAEKKYWFKALKKSLNGEKTHGIK